MNSHLNRYFTNTFLNSESEVEFRENFNQNLWKNYLEASFLQCMSAYKPKSSHKYCDGGIYVGSLGLIFPAYKILQCNILPSHENQIKKYILDVINANEKYFNDNDSNTKSTEEVGFLLGMIFIKCIRKNSFKLSLIYYKGKGGLYLLASLAFKLNDDLNNELNYAYKYANASSICKDIDFLKKGSDEMFVGRAGYLW